MKSNEHMTKDGASLRLANCGAQKKRSTRKNYPYVLAIASGKGGVGKTLTTVNFAMSASLQGLKVLILDGDMGLANVDIVLGLRAKYNIRDVLDGSVSLAETILDGPFGMKLIPSGSGITSLQTLSTTQRLILLEQIACLDEDFDLLIIDSGAGIGGNVLHLSAIANRRVIVTTSEPHAFTDAYALIKVLAEEKNIGSFDLLLNMVHSRAEGDAVAARICKVANDFLGVKINYLGSIPRDASVSDRLLRGQAVSAESLHALAGQAWHQVATRLMQDGQGQRDKQKDGDFWASLLGPQESGFSGLARASS